ncbi:MAG: asparagine synthetase B [Kordiimonas sp.]|nr:asparagine synthetase B [Kordiimonas sp.]|tara:strand:+ start:7329 stop:9251 length:1923 start_codon:yes stop_codon:yes gene_type:complete
MCGIVGIFDTRQKGEVDIRLLQRMNDVQSHRGPDEQGIFQNPGIGLGHRRLSIIDLSSGQQPLFNEDKSVVVVYNGEIYNFPELRQQLSGRGYRFSTHCDTEVIVNAWSEWGENCVDHFRGMFAFAIWDLKKEVLFLARDRLGIKPLFYTLQNDGKFYFASELKSIQQVQGLERGLDPQAVEEYFSYGYVPDPKTIYRNIYKLPPGHTLTLRHGQTKLVSRQYWDIAFKDMPVNSIDELGEELIERFNEAVKIRMVADVPLGAFLSGGVDSSSVVALMAQNNNEPINTYSIGFDRPDYDETDFAQEVAEQYRTNHKVRMVDPNDFGLIDKLAAMYDEPYADSSAMPTYRVCQLARENVTVALSGDGGDEIFAGYRRHRWHMNEERLRSRMPYGLRKGVFGLMGAVYPKMDWAPRYLRAKSTFQALAMSSAEAYFHSVSVVSQRQRSNMFSAGLKRDLQGYNAVSILQNLIDNAPVEDDLAKIQYADIKTYLPGDILTKVDRASMAHSLEVRVPILDHKFMEWSAGIPAALRLQGRQGKYIFKKALEKHLSDNILYRDKMGFAVPLESWFRHELRQRVQDTVKSEILADTGFFDMDNLQKIADDHQSGAWNYTTAIWALMMFEASLRNAEGYSHSEFKQSA